MEIIWWKEDNRETRVAVKDQEANQLQVETRKKSVEKLIQGIAAASIQKAPMHIPTTSGKVGALRELLRQSQAPSRMPEAPMRTLTPPSLRVMVPTSVHQSILTVPIVSRTRAAQAAATKLSQGPARNTHAQSKCALERVLHTANFLDKKSVASKKTRLQYLWRHWPSWTLIQVKCSNINNLPITKIRISAGHGTHQRPTKSAVYFRAWGKESKTPLAPAISSEENKCHWTGTVMSHRENFNVQSTAKRHKDKEHD